MVEFDIEHYKSLVEKELAGRERGRELARAVGKARTALKLAEEELMEWQASEEGYRPMIMGPSEEYLDSFKSAVRKDIIESRNIDKTESGLEENTQA